ncbi:MAG: ATP-binding protein [Acidobacteriota bacterium]
MKGIGEILSPLLPGVEDLFRSAPCFMTVQDREGRILAANENFQATFGGSVGAFCFAVYKGRGEKCRDCPVDETFADGRCHVSQQVVALPDGRSMPILVYTSPVLGPDGSVRAVVEVSADLSPVKALENKLRRSRERYRALFEDVPCYISVQDRDLRIVESNRAFREDFGDRVGAFCFDVYKHRSEPCLNCPVARTFEDGNVHHSEEIVTALDGRQVNTLVSTAPIRNGDGEIEMVMEMSTNITEIRSLQGQLANLGLLVGSVSHGIKGLLTGLDGGMYMMNTGIERQRPERVEEGWKMIRRNVEQIRSVVLDLLYVAKEREPVWESASLKDLAYSALEAVRPRAESLGVHLEAHLEEVGPCDMEPKSLHAALVNLLENALDACRVDRRKDRHSVRFGLARENGSAVLTVEDDGIGMDRETRERIFTLFFSSKGLEGTGLGLFISHKVVEKHGGDISVDSEPGRGTRFRVRLPFVRSAPP